MGDIKIADFGLSKLVLPDEIMKMPCGTLSYVAPEVSAQTSTEPSVSTMQHSADDYVYIRFLRLLLIAQLRCCPWHVWRQRTAVAVTFSSSWCYA